MVDIKIIGESPAFLDVMDQISHAAPMERSVLVIGERGTGKELIAARLHYLSQRWDKGYQKMNCAALPENLLDSELFGYEAGAFTGASKRRIGRFEAADGGTLFLDEIGTLTPAAQEKLLRIIEYGEFERIGGNETVKVDVRVLGATNIDLPAAADRGAFRHDLLDRLAFDVITVPPLRERQEDIEILAEFFGRQMATEQEWLQFPGFTEDAVTRLLNHQWPGNIRELKNVIERAVYRAWDGEAPLNDIVFDPFDSPFRPPVLTATADQPSTQTDKAVAEIVAETVLPSGPFDLRAKLNTHEKTLITHALGLHKFNQRSTARHLHLSYDQLRHAMKKHTLL